MSKTSGYKKGDSVEDESLFTIWPEWSETEVATEKWGGKHAYEDPEGPGIVPRSIRKYFESYKRASDIAGESNSIVVVQPSTFDELLLAPNGRIVVPDIGNERHWKSNTERKKLGDLKELEFETILDNESLSSGASKLLQTNSSLLQSDFFLSLLSCIHYCYEIFRLSKTTGAGDEFLPWDNIYPKGKDGLPSYNPSGKYLVKIYWLGAWRKIAIDDRIPVDINGKPLLLSSSFQNELWPLILSKALIKVANSR
jgi:hypothetical protein